MELPYSGGNDGKFPVSSPPISPCCQLKLLTCLAQANQVSFLPTKEGLLSTSTEGAYLHTYSKIRNGASSEGPAQSSKLPGLLLLLQNGYCPGNRLVILHCPLLTSLTQTPPLELPLLSQAHSWQTALFAWYFESTIDHSYASSQSPIQLKLFP